MTYRTLWGLGAVSTLGLLLIAGGCTRAASNPPAEVSDTNSVAEVPLEAGGTEMSVPDAEQAQATAPVEASGGPVTQVPPSPVPPSSVRSAGPAGDLIRMADSGVGAPVLEAFVANTPSAFSLNADEIIYLNARGVPSSVVEAVMQHDQAVQGFAQATVVPAPDLEPPPPSPVEPGTMAAQFPPPNMGPTGIAPQTGYATEPAPAPPGPPTEEVSDSTFDDALSPYGNWVEVAGYGRCWQPAVIAANPAWQPYCDGGRWIWTNHGWYWLSDYSWGWAPFHYGRWFRHSNLGWCWSPGTVWGPCWVYWLYDDSYCGWAPLPPGAGYVSGVGLVVRGSVVTTAFQLHLSPLCFAFVPWGSFPEHHLHQFTLAHDHVNQIFDHTHSVTGADVGHHKPMAPCPAPERVIAATHRQIQTVVVRDASVVSMRTGRGEMLAGDGRTVHTFRLGKTPSAPAQAPAGFNQAPPDAPRTELGGAPHASLPPQALQRPTLAPTTISAPKPASHGSLVVIGQHDRMRAQAPSTFGGQTDVTAPASQTAASGGGQASPSSLYAAQDSESSAAPPETQAASPAPLRVHNAYPRPNQNGQSIGQQPRTAWRGFNNEAHAPRWPATAPSVAASPPAQWTRPGSAAGYQAPTPGEPFREARQFQPVRVESRPAPAAPAPAAAVPPAQAAQPPPSPPVNTQRPNNQPDHSSQGSSSGSSSGTSSSSGARNK